MMKDLHEDVTELFAQAQKLGVEFFDFRRHSSDAGYNVLVRRGAEPAPPLETQKPGYRLCSSGARSLHWELERDFPPRGGECFACKRISSERYKKTKVKRAEARRMQVAKQFAQEVSEAMGWRLGRIVAIDASKNTMEVRLEVPVELVNLEAETIAVLGTRDFGRGMRIFVRRREGTPQEGWDVEMAE